MKNGLNFDFNDYENWKKEKAYKLQELIINAFLTTGDKYSDEDILIHKLCRELLIASGFTNSTLNFMLFLQRGIDHESKKL